MFRFCPSCASGNIRFERGRVFRCPDCGFTFYQNTAAAVCCIIEAAEGIVFIVRGKDPAKGKLALPGGFIDPGEGALEGLRRELREELGWEPGDAVFGFFASFPNTYPYKNISYHTCDLFFSVSAPALTEKDFKLEEAEIAGVRFTRPEDINFDDIAFDSAKNALKAWLKTRKRQIAAPQTGV